MRAALITGLAGTSLSAEERSFLREARPAGIILFARNCRDHAGIRRLIADSLDAIGEKDTLVLIDQEGGRVQRLRPPLGRTLPPAAVYGALASQDPAAACAAVRTIMHLLAEDLLSLGINTDCAPVLDVPVPGAHDIIGDRAFCGDPGLVAALGRAAAEGLLAGGVLPVVKHIPGHGRAGADSHLELPIVTARHAELSATDFAPFRALADIPAAMTAHVVYADIDPTSPATTSARVVSGIIRGEIGFDGFLMSDDLSMKALRGTIRDRAAASIAAGCDVALHCNGDLTEMQEALAGVPALSGAASRRFARAWQARSHPSPADAPAATGMLAALTARGSAAGESV